MCTRHAYQAPGGIGLINAPASNRHVGVYLNTVSRVDHHPSTRLSLPSSLSTDRRPHFLVSLATNAAMSTDLRLRRIPFTIDVDQPGEPSLEQHAALRELDMILDPDFAQECSDVGYQAAFFLRDDSLDSELDEVRADEQAQGWCLLSSFVRW